MKLRRRPQTFAGRRVSATGSATLELVVIVPFVLILLAMIWDVREYIGYRTELVRDLFVVAEAIADDPDGKPPFDAALGEAERWLKEASVAGAIRAAVIVRGDRRHDGTACPAGAWCPPKVAFAWPAAGKKAGTWSKDAVNVCLDSGAPLPAQGNHFRAAQRVLPNEGADPDGDGPLAARAEQDWSSRNLSGSAWWVVVDACVDPAPGVFIGRLTNLAARMFDASFTLHQRAFWASVHDLGDCTWCEP